MSRNKAGWRNGLRSGLQPRLSRFDSGSGLYRKVPSENLGARPHKSSYGVFAVEEGISGEGPNRICLKRQGNRKLRLTGKSKTLETLVDAVPSNLGEMTERPNVLVTISVCQTDI